MSVAAILVSHAGERWLPTVLDALAAQHRRPDQIIAVDTGSKDASAQLLRDRLGPEAVLTAPRSTSFGAAVALGLDRVGQHEWVWILHDDARPADDALARLLEVVAAQPDVGIIGPKLREWPSLRRLLELGVTITGTGRRETGLETGEYDQGQHDDVREVLAVNTAGMLVRTEVLRRLGGFDERLPIFGNDVDFGWRAAAAGVRTLIAPAAVVFHAEAAHRGLRRTPLTGRHTHYQERYAALYTLLANCSGAVLPVQIVRLALGSLLRVLGFLLVRSPGEALDELAALLAVYSRPTVIIGARRSRRELRERADRVRVRRLLAPTWLPYRRALDDVTDFFGALTLHAQDVAERRRAAAAPPTPVRGTAVEDDEIPVESGWLVRFLTDPVALGSTAFLILSTLATRAAWGPVSGGALVPAPERAAAWWQLYVESWHPLAQGTGVPAPPYLLPLAAIGSLLGGSGPAAVTALLVLAIPVAWWGAWRMLRVIGHLMHAAGAPRWLLAVGAAGYALLPLTTGAWGAGRLGPVGAVTLLPWLGHAALGFLDPDPDRRWRAGWRTGLLLSVLTAFAPATWPVAVLLVLLALVALTVTNGRAAWGQPSAWGPPVAMICVPVVLLVPWWLPLLQQGHWFGLVLEAGRPIAADWPVAWIATGRLTDLAAPAALGRILAVVALLALLARTSRPVAVTGWTTGLAAAVVISAASRLSLESGDDLLLAGLGGPYLLLCAGVYVAAWSGAVAVCLAQRARPGVSARIATAVVLVASLAVPVAGLAWSLLLARDQFGAAPDSDIPAYMQQQAARGPEHGVLVLSGSIDEGLALWVHRGDGPTLGEIEILALSPAPRTLVAAVAELVARPSQPAVKELAGQGVEYVVLRPPVDGRVAAVLDAAPGLEQASAEDRSARAWQVAEPAASPGLVSRTSLVRRLLVGAQVLAVLVVAVLCGPTRRRRR